MNEIQNVISTIDFKSHAYKQKCKIDESKRESEYGDQKHSCLSNADCRGSRYCTAFGWCRGKSLCTEEELKEACQINEDVKAVFNRVEKGQKRCSSDYDCKGSKTCDMDYDFVCVGEDQVCV